MAVYQGAKIEKENKAKALGGLAEYLNETYGGYVEVDDGYAVPVDKSPLDGKLMWVVFSVTPKTIQTHKWGKGERPYYDGYEVAKEYARDKAVKAKNAADRKANNAAKAERDKKARAKKTDEKAE